MNQMKRVHKIILILFLVAFIGIQAKVEIKQEYNKKLINVNRNPDQDIDNQDAIYSEEKQEKKRAQLVNENEKNSRIVYLDSISSGKQLNDENNNTIKENKATEKNSTQEKKNSYQARLVVNGSIIILLTIGIYTLIVFGVLFTYRTEFLKYNDKLNQTIGGLSGWEPIITFVLFPVFIGNFIWSSFIDRDKTSTMMFSFSLLPIIGFIAFTSDFLFKMNEAGLSDFYQALLIILQIVCMYVMPFFGYALFDEKMNLRRLFTKNPLIPTCTAISIIYIVYGFLEFFLASEYIFCAEHIYRISIISFLFGAVVGLQILIKILNFLTKKFVSSNAKKRFEGYKQKTQGPSPVPHSNLIFSIGLGLLCSAGFIAVSYFGASFLLYSSAQLVSIVVEYGLKLWYGGIKEAIFNAISKANAIREQNNSFEIPI